MAEVERLNRLARDDLDRRRRRRSRLPLRVGSARHREEAKQGSGKKEIFHELITPLGKFCCRSIYGKPPDPQVNRDSL